MNKALPREVPFSKLPQTLLLQVSPHASGPPYNNASDLAAGHHIYHNRSAEYRRAIKKSAFSQPTSRTRQERECIVQSAAYYRLPFRHGTLSRNAKKEHHKEEVETAFAALTSAERALGAECSVCLHI
ncbi:hypothetical protein QAD02_022546 [Eretmocerus hayati]|uniref:Uncharacterized protein n=1 Tax=Eretmocerus hayati TaxID=131215 RepID=A0ACC2PTK3_9HYME|nr:hypothetical protein QAD02_022546 [Eretmocerus hayati]